MTTEVKTGQLEADRSLRRYNGVKDLIGSRADPTPMVHLSRLCPDQGDLYVKLEWMNPFGSVKDRPARRMLRRLQESGALEGKDIVEPTSGNTGIALAALAALMGKDLVVTIPEGVPEEKKVLLRMLGAEVWPTPDDLCPVDHPRDGAIALAHSFVDGEQTQAQYTMPNQYGNEDNLLAHYESTGPEIWDQTEGEVTHFFAGVGTCGTLTGVGRYLKEQNETINIVAVEPQKNHRLPGLKNLEESKEPEILDRSVVDRFIRVDDAAAYEMTRRLFREEALMAGPSTGAILHVARTIMDEDGGGIGVVISPDSGLKYTSYFEELLGDEGKPEV